MDDVPKPWNARDVERRRQTRLACRGFSHSPGTQMIGADPHRISLMQEKTGQP